MTNKINIEIQGLTALKKKLARIANLKPVDINIVIVNHMEYAVCVEYGTGLYSIHPNAKKEVIRPKGNKPFPIKTPNGVIYRWSIDGIKPAGMLRNSIDDVRNYEKRTRKNINWNAKNLEAELQSHFNNVAVFALNKIKENTPRDTGALSRAWKIEHLKNV